MSTERTRQRPNAERPRTRAVPGFFAGGHCHRRFIADGGMQAGRGPGTALAALCCAYGRWQRYGVSTAARGQSGAILDLSRHSRRCPSTTSFSAAPATSPAASSCRRSITASATARSSTAAASSASRGARWTTTTTAPSTREALEQFLPAERARARRRVDALPASCSPTSRSMPTGEPGWDRLTAMLVGRRRGPGPRLLPRRRARTSSATSAQRIGAHGLVTAKTRVVIEKPVGKRPRLGAAR